MINSYNYSIDKTGITESNLEINLISNLNRVNVNSFIKRYKVSNFFKGKYFLKRLIKKIFKYKIKKNMIWIDSFWDDVNIYIIESKIQFLSPNNNDQAMKDYIKLHFSKKRLKDIFKYKNMLEKNISLDYPLFIDGYSLNMLGSNSNNKKLFMLDGSRRIIASLLCKKQVQKIYLISYLDL